MFGEIYEGKRVLITGNTGFKGSWLTSWLLYLGAEVAGYSVDVPTDPSNYRASGLETSISHTTGDIRNLATLGRAMDDFRPDFVFHLAAQSLIRRSYADPIATFAINTMGTINVLECLRQRPWVSAAVIVTSDKCYRNEEWVWGYRENDPLGGEDPYSGSKACAELAAYSYIHSFFGAGSSGTRVATARAGNVIGGGDWAEDRLVPDCMRSWSQGQPSVIRNPSATRPWQHVLEPLSGYLWLGARLWENAPQVVGAAYNFGPSSISDNSVGALVESLREFWPNAKSQVSGEQETERREAILLRLSCDKALAELQWHSVLSFQDTVRFTAEWYRAYYEDPGQYTMQIAHNQIEEYCRQARARELLWSLS